MIMLLCYENEYNECILDTICIHFLVLGFYYLNYLVKYLFYEYFNLFISPPILMGDFTKFIYNFHEKHGLKNIKISSENFRLKPYKYIYS